MSLIMPRESSETEETLTNQSEIVLRELHTFLNGVSRTTRVRNTEVAHSAIYLLKFLPAARDAVLEHMYNLFDEAVNNYVLKLELDDNSAVAKNVKDDEITIQELHQVLSNFVKTNPEVWAPIISTWSLDLLGYLSSKYADRHFLPRSSSLPEILQLWMGCHPTRTLIDMTTQCLSTLISTNPDTCIDALLETSVRHSPHFDWVVAHIGSCFPTTVITRVLACGLKDYCIHQDMSEESLAGCSKKAPKMASVVGILGHLAAHHDDNIRCAILSLFQESFVNNPTREQLSTVPFLLHLAAMSDMLSHVISSEFVKVVTPDTLNKMSNQITQWKAAKVPGTEGLISLIVHLLLRSDGGSQVIRCLLEIVVPDPSKNLNPGIQHAAGLVLDHVLLEIQRRVHGGSPEIPLLHFLKQHISELSIYLSDMHWKRCSWILNLLKFICSHGGQKTSITVIGHLLCNVERKEVAVFIREMFEHIELAEPNIVFDVISQQLSDLKSSRINKPVRLIKNIIILIRSTKYRKQICEALECHLDVVAMQISSYDMEYSNVLIELLSLSACPEKMSMPALFQVCSLAISYYFTLLKANLETEQQLKMLKVIQQLLGSMSQQSAAQNLILRTLLEGIVDPENCCLFESKLSSSDSYTTHSVSLFKENRKYATSITLPQSHSSVFHAGVIGSGLRIPKERKLISKDKYLFNKQIILDTIHACCYSSWRFPFEKSSIVYPQSMITGMKIIALLLVELISPDVMFNGLPWPEEEFLKVTIERDLGIKRKFEEHPILWDILFLVARVHPSLCYCSVLLRAVMAVLLTHWNGCQEKLASNSLKQLETTQKLIDVMAIGQLLPPPLSYVGEILPHLSPFETYCILTDIWQYMKDNIPTPALFTIRDLNSGRVWRKFETGNGDDDIQCDSKYTDSFNCSSTILWCFCL